MIHFWELLFWFSVAWLFYVYFGYALCLWVLGAFRTFREEKREDYLPRVSVLISARNEAKDIEWKVRETLDWDYPAELLEVLVASDASEDGTDEILQRITHSRLKYLRMPQRAGKNEALNRLSQLATGELLFFTDANSHVGPNCLRSMVRHFADSRVGCVTGIERNQLPEGSVEIGARAYLEYEAVINNLESRLGSVLVCDGSIFCIRRMLFSTLQQDLANDLESPIRIGSKGFALLFEPEACSLERSTSSIREEFNRRRRICGQGALGLWRLRASLKGLRAWQFVSRKLLRWLSFIPVLLVFISTAMLAAHPLFALAFVVEGICFLLALIAGVFVLWGHKSNWAIAFPLFFLLSNAAALIGVLEACLGRRYAVWEIPALSRGSTTASRPEREGAVSPALAMGVEAEVSTSSDGAVRHGK